MASLALLTTLISCLAFAWTSNGQGPEPGQIKTIVTFGDSYTDVVGAHILREDAARLIHNTRRGTVMPGTTAPPGPYTSRTTRT